MRICMIYPGDMSVRNGGRTHATELIEKWSQRGHSITVITYWSSSLDGMKDVTYIRIPMFSHTGINGLTFSLLSTVYLFWLAIFQRIDVIYERKCLLSLSPLMGRVFRIRVFIEINDIPYSIALCQRHLISDSIMDRFIRFSFSIDIFTTFRIGCGYVLTASIKIPQITENKRVLKIPFGANTEIFRPLDMETCRSKAGLVGSSPIVLFVGTLLNWQGLEYVIRAMPVIRETFSETKMVIVGDAEPGLKSSLEYKEFILEEMHRLKQEMNIVFAGRVSYEKVPLFINSADVCVIAQTTARRGFTPLKMFEYMSCGKAVVASDLEGIREIINQTGSGILYEPENAEALARAVIKVISSPEDKAKFERSGIEATRVTYNWINFSDRILDFISK